MSTSKQLNKEEQSSKIDIIEESLRKEKPSLFNGLPKDRTKEIIKSVAFSVKSHSGPLPDPDTLERYNEIIPNGADRIMAGFEKQLNHRINVESIIVKGKVSQSNRGQYFAFIIALSVLLASFYLIFNDHDVAGTVLGSVDLVALVAVFITGKSSQNTKSSDKESK